jgi:hypothetical protein
MMMDTAEGAPMRRVLSPGVPPTGAGAMMKQEGPLPWPVAR